MSTKKRPFSPVDEFIKTFNEMSARYSRNELWYNYIDMHAIALANTCDSRCRDTREEQYNAIVQKYDWCCTIKVDIENSKGQYIEKDKQEATKDGSESTKIQHGI